ncbi:hypothetical protein [Methylobacterium sp. JK268]
MPLILDTLIVTRRLRDAGIDQVHAEAHAEVARDLILADVASREELRHEFAQLRAELKAFEEALINRVTKIVASILIGVLSVAGGLAALLTNFSKFFGH